jgi:integrase
VWLEERKTRGLRVPARYASLWRKHVEPRFGQQPVTSIRLEHVRRLVSDLASRADGPAQLKLAPRSVRNVYNLLRAFFRGAERAGLIDRSPCRLEPSELPANRDGPGFRRADHVFAAEEIAALLRSPAVELVDRAYYGLIALAWMRPGEAMELRWGDIDWSARPLARITVSRALSEGVVRPTKTSISREAPVSPILGALLTELRDGGWAEVAGRSPGPEDLVLCRRGADGSIRALEKKRQSDRWRRHERALGLVPHRWPYDLKAAGMTLAQEAGAPTAVVSAISHDPQTVVAGYSRFSWAARCEAVMALHRALVGARQLSLL